MTNEKEMTVEEAFSLGLTTDKAYHPANATYYVGLITRAWGEIYDRFSSYHHPLPINSALGIYKYFLNNKNDMLDLIDMTKKYMQALETELKEIN